ncbi:SMP-30/gluconolactonase/LRE family protein [Rhodococcus sp. T2V]|uniref:SMP-30/gluconolactonase/LRE family protein n=1 Tax=Rhodococcus sp. T2V TaxID=3034164 RepID=UPI0023E2978E|nr:SMP-30/gluconolactonase/LRE family protein [Rhodococcus sp. T2V]MDF3303409.1 SMP-30/gluconolactonase/LRE family protein [Rhodococcus sp. T2V]
MDFPILGVEDLSYPEAVSLDRYELGEGPLWDDARKRLTWVDIYSGSVWESDPELIQPVCVASFDSPVSCVLRVNNELLVAVGVELYRVTEPGPVFVASLANEVTGAIRFNDGAVDAWGRVWIGTMSEDGRREAWLYRLDADRSVMVREYGPVTISNGIGWSHDNTKMFYVDTPTRMVMVFEYGPDGICGDPQVFADLSEFDGEPDGLAVDSAGSVWIAMWGGAQLLEVSGSGVRRHKLPFCQPTSICFGGADLMDIYVTSAYRSLARPNHFDGRVFKFRRI